MASSRGDVTMDNLICNISGHVLRLLGNIYFFRSQKGQDKWVILEILPFKRRGFFVDLGASDGVTTNNTYALEKLFNWSGICIEPNPGFLELIKERRRCVVADSVVSDRNEEVRFRIDNGSLGGIVADDTDNNRRLRADELETATIVSRRSVTLNEVLDRYNAPSVIDYLSLDVEGAEERVIRSLDFTKYRFRCMTVERPTPVVNEILAHNAYVFVKNHHFDSFYVHSSVLKGRKIRCEQFEQVPPKGR
jgi:FkbM family methyltransferase